MPNQIQGTVVTFSAPFTDRETGDVLEPNEVIATVLAPSGDTETQRMTLGEVELVDDEWVVYVNTSAEAGIWTVQFQCILAEQSLVKKTWVRVEPGTTPADPEEDYELIIDGGEV
jgi:hypothetical protein